MKEPEMRWERFGDHYVLRLETDEEAVSTLKAFVGEEEIRGGCFIGLGAFRRVRFRYFNAESKAYEDNAIERQVEVVSLMGNIAQGDDGSPRLHIHGAAGDREGRTFSGHLAEGIVRPTLELFLTQLSGRMRREKDPATGLELLSLGRSYACP